MASSESLPRRSLFLTSVLGMKFIASLVLMVSPLSVRAFSTADADAAFDAFNNAFYVLNDGKGYYKSDTTGGHADFWKSAEEIEMIIDAYERTGNPAHKAMISQSIDGFMDYYGSDWLWNDYNDDIMWIVIACCRAYTITGNDAYLDRARYHFDAVYDRGWDNALGGGIWWTTAKGEKNAANNGPSAIAACMLYEIYGDPAYLSKAQAIYAWERSVLFEVGTGKVYDNITSSGVVNTNWIFTYNQGTFIGAANYLHKFTGDSAYYADALQAALYSMNGLCTTEILPEYGDDGDGGGFTSIFARWMMRFVRDQNLWSTFQVWMSENANAAWAVRRGDNLSWCKWRTQTPEGKLYSFGCCSSVAILQAVPADYGAQGLPCNPIALTGGSYNRDVVVEHTAPPPPAPGAYTTASMETGEANTTWSWYEVGYNTGAPTTGLPAANTLFASVTHPDHLFRMAPSYTANNVLLLNSSLTTGTLTVNTPTAYTRLSFLVGAAHGPGSVRAMVVHQNGTVQTNILTVPDWFFAANRALTANGRVDVQSFAFGNVNSDNPRLYSADVVLANTSSPVTRVDFAHISGGQDGVFAVSGSVGATFTPILVNGYNQDVIVEASAPKHGMLNGVTTATMDGGTANTGRTWYETGYSPLAPHSGLPAAGSTLTSMVDASHRYTLAPSYTTNNAVFLSAAVRNASAVLSAPANYSTLSFLASASRGPVAVGFQIRHADGALQNGLFQARDWFNQAPMAFVANGAVNTTTGGLDEQLANNPRLYSADYSVANTGSPITNITFTFGGGPSGSAAVILAVSGIPGVIAPQITAQPSSLTGMEGSNVGLSATAVATEALSLQWQRGTNGVFTDLINEGNVSGANTSSLSFAGIGMRDAADYRLVAYNASGSATSQVAVVTVMSALPSVAQPGDLISGFGGTSPGGEEVTNAINTTTDKYLNFGLNGGSGSFSGPVGFVVTPSIGPSVVKYLRLFTANDEPGRDPASYTFYGSLDGGATYALISAGPLALPEGRNPSGLALNPLTQNVQQIALSNSRSFTTYKLNINTIKTSSASMTQIGEVELLGSLRPVLNVVAGGVAGTLTLSSSVPGTLWSTDSLPGTNTVWQSEGPIPGTVVITPSASIPVRFYRVSVP